MTLLQQLIKDSIIRNGGSAKFEEIVRDLSKVFFFSTTNGNL